MSDTTIIIPSHERPRRLRRIMDFFAASGMPMIVIDSSAAPYAAALPPTAHYHHRPDLYLTEKLRIAANMVQTPFSTICADDDFLWPDAIKRAAGFLAGNPGYASAQGLSMFYFVPNAGTVWLAPKYEPLALRRLKLNFEDADPKVRLHSAFTTFMQWVYSVHRTDALRHATEILCGIELKHLCYTDRLFSFGLTLCGNLKLLPMLFSVREQAPMTIPPHELFCPMLKTQDPRIRADFQEFSGYLDHQWQTRFQNAPGSGWIDALFNSYCKFLEPGNKPPVPEKGDLQLFQCKGGVYLVRKFSNAFAGYFNNTDSDGEFLFQVSQSILSNFSPEILMNNIYPGRTHFEI